VALAACARRVIDKSSRSLTVWSNLPTGVYRAQEIIPQMLEHQDNLIGEPVACLFRRIAAARGFHPRHRQSTDIEMWFHLLEKGGLAYDSEPLVPYRQHAAQASEFHHLSGRAREEHQLLILEKARLPGIPESTRCRVLFAAERGLRRAPSANIRLATEGLAVQLNPMRVFSRGFPSPRGEPFPAGVDPSASDSLFSPAGGGMRGMPWPVIHWER
jgi:hypothetical protein